jgi:hypothetical protein
MDGSFWRFKARMVTVIVPLLCPRPLPRVRFFSPWFRSKMRSGSPQIGHANATARGGTLEYGGLFSMQVEGAQKHRTGLHIEISGTEGVLRITNSLAFQNKDDNAIERHERRRTDLLATAHPRSVSIACFGLVLTLAHRTWLTFMQHTQVTQ